jgi:hypothetical protein
MPLTKISVNQNRLRELKITEAQAKRNQILLETVDRLNSIWWEAMTEEQKNHWRSYRQALLDIPDQPEYPFDILWPEKPE